MEAVCIPCGAAVEVRWLLRPREWIGFCPGCGGSSFAKHREVLAEGDRLAMSDPADVAANPTVIDMREGQCQVCGKRPPADKMPLCEMCEQRRRQLARSADG